MSKLSDWPAMQDLGSAPILLQCERAIYGKVHGQRTDFRWLARSPGFRGASADLIRAALTGGEDQPQRFTAWRKHEEHYYAIACYPSRARDAAGRSGFLEKHLLEWKAEPNVPVALAAAVLISEAEDKAGDTEWWNTSSDTAWSNPGHFVPIAPCKLSVDTETVEQRLIEGLKYLDGSLGRSALQGIYAQLLAGRQTTVYDCLRQPLTSLALAALLLPLPPNEVEGLSVTGWSPFTAAPEAALSQWRLVFSAPGRVGKQTSAQVDGSRESRAKDLAESICSQNADWAWEPREPILKFLEFRHNLTRWLERSDVPMAFAPLKLKEQEIFRKAVDEIRAEAQCLPPGTPSEFFEARRRHLESKAAVLEAASADLGVVIPSDSVANKIRRRWHGEV